METRTYNVYKFGELSDKQKEKAIERLRAEDYLFPWDDEYRESLDGFCGVFPVKWKDYDATYRRDIDYDLTCDDEVMDLSGEKLRKYLRENYIQQVKDSCPFTGFCADEDLIQPIRNYMKGKLDRTKLFADLMNECLHSFLKSLQSDYEYHYSDEGIKEMIESNDYDFTDDGSIA